MTYIYKEILAGPYGIQIEVGNTLVSDVIMTGIILNEFGKSILDKLSYYGIIVDVIKNQPIPYFPDVTVREGIQQEVIRKSNDMINSGKILTNFSSFKWGNKIYQVEGLSLPGITIKLDDYYYNIHSDISLLIHRLRLITDNQVGDIDKLLDSAISQLDLDIHEKILNERIKIGSDYEKNAKWDAHSSGDNFVIYYGLDFEFFKWLYWDIGIANNDPDIQNLAIYLYRKHWSGLKSRFSIPTLHDNQWQQLLTALMTLGKFVLFAYITAITVGYANGFLSKYLVTGSKIVTEGSYAAQLMETGAYTQEQALAIEAGEVHLIGDTVTYVGSTGELVAWDTGEILTGAQLSQLASGKTLAEVSVTGVSSYVKDVTGGLSSVEKTMAALVGIKGALSSFGVKEDKQEVLEDKKYSKLGMGISSNIVLMSITGIILYLAFDED